MTQSNYLDTLIPARQDFPAGSNKISRCHQFLSIVTDLEVIALPLEILKPGSHIVLEAFWFDEIGMGTQYKTDKSVKQLISPGCLRIN